MSSKGRKRDSDINKMEEREREKKEDQREKEQMSDREVKKEKQIELRKEKKTTTPVLRHLNYVQIRLQQYTQAHHELKNLNSARQI